jgi:hypothetical protein
LLTAFFLGVIAFSGSACAQEIAAVDSSSSDAAQNSLPSAPAPQTTPADQPAQQTKRILGIIPNFRAISADQKSPA